MCIGRTENGKYNPVSVTCWFFGEREECKKCQDKYYGKRKVKG